MSIIQIQNLTFGYDGSSENVFEDVSLRLDTTWKLGFTGRNGRGKTTFLNLLLGKFPYRGSISAPVTFEYFPSPIQNPKETTFNVVRTLVSCEDWQLLRELSLLDVPEHALDRPFDTLSNGEQTKVLLAALFLLENGFPLIDEPTNHLDEDARRTVSAYLRGKSGFILVSHDRTFLDSCVDHILSINKTNIEIQKGNFSSWFVNKQRQDAYEQGENERLRQDIAHLKEAARRISGWSYQLEKTKKSAFDSGYIGHKSAKEMKRAKAIEKRRQDAIDEKSKLLKNIEYASELSIHPLTHHSSVLAELSEVSIHYGSHVVCPPVSFTLREGEQVALCGKNGCGKSSILKLLCGEDIPHTGVVRLASGIKISRVRQDFSDLSGSLDDYVDSLQIDKSLFMTILRKLDFNRAQFERDISSYSAGQKKKVLLAGSLSESAHLYLWDEPLNYIDVLSRIQIEDLIRTFRPTMLFVEHDAAFRRNLSAKEIYL